MAEKVKYNNKVLFVDDEPELLTTYALMLRKTCNVFTAADGESALELMKNDGPFAVVISDYNMPGMNGIQFLTEVKSLSPNSVRIILTSSDDIKTASYAVNESNIFRFLTKPIDKKKLQLAIDASIEQYRLIRAENELNQKLQIAYDRIKQDLESAAKVQQKLLPPKKINLSGVEFNAKFIPSVFLSGDNYNYFNLDNQRIGFYLLDVSGHGIPSAMHSFVLSNYITPDTAKYSPLKEYNPINSVYDVLPPAKVVDNLNERFYSYDTNMNYFTMAYGIIDLNEHTVQIIHAGHPPSLLIKRNGNIEILKQRNFPLGVFKNVDYYQKEFIFEKGDRLLVYSDGVTECRNSDKDYFSEERLVDFIKKNKFKNSIELINDIEAELKKWHVEKSFQDDVTFFLIEMKT